MGAGLFRLLLSSLVVVHHYSSFSIGVASVYIFFALSGFWIYEMWTKKYCLAKNPYITFIISRIWRIAPVFLLCSMLALLVVCWSIVVEPSKPFPRLGLDSIFSSFVLIGYDSLSFKPLVPAWSLDIEMQFYLLAPIIVASLNRKPLLVMLFIICISIMTNIISGNKLLISLLPWFLIGMLVAKYSYYLRANNLGNWSGIAVFFTLSLFTFIPSLHPILFGGMHPAPLFKFNLVLNVAVALIAMPLVFTSVFNRGGRFDRLFSDLSYSLYLFHWIPLQVVNHYFPEINQLPFLSRLPFSMSLILITYVVSLGITLWIDRPINEIRSRFVRDRVII